MKLFKKNETEISGNIANVDFRTGNNGPYGNILLMVDDGYFKKGDNNQQGAWVERSYPITIKMNSNLINQAGQSGYQKGDFLAVSGKNVVEFGKDQQGNIDQSKKYPKIEAKSIIQHLSAHIAKQLRTDISSDKQQSQGNNQQPQQQNSGGGYQQSNQQPQQHNNGGGYQPNNQQPQQHNNGGGYQQNNQQPQQQNGRGNQQQNHYANQH